MNNIKIGQIELIVKDFLKENNYTNYIILVDEKTKKHCLPKVIGCFDHPKIIQIKSSESQKNLNTCIKIWEAMTHLYLDRNALMINLGGGVIGDMGGFCASTYKRGIDFIQIPTTLLSQVDASVGGKLGIDFQSFKNHIGVFKVPKSVLIDPDFLQTLPLTELRSGFAEVIKHCLILDRAMWNQIKRKDLDQQDWEILIKHSVELKSKVTEEDPTEKGLRKILNFGHTLGHAIETYFLGGKHHLLHGEAIATGMICESYLSFKHGKLSTEELNEIEDFIFSIYGKINLKSEHFDSIIQLTAQDKKNYKNEVRFALLNGIGSCDYDLKVSKKEMYEALEFYAQS
ncbi:MAG: 3-dehydroquinate synthase [Bacteroidota bacterium]